MNKGLGLFAIGALAFFVLRGWQRAPTAPTAALSYPPDVTGATGTIATPSLGGVGAPAFTGMPEWAQITGKERAERIYQTQVVEPFKQAMALPEGAPAKEAYWTGMRYTKFQTPTDWERYAAAKLSPTEAQTAREIRALRTQEELDRWSEQAWAKGQIGFL